MKTAIFALATAILAILFSSQVHAQAFENDNDGLLDVGEAPGFPADPMAAPGILSLTAQGIQDLDGTSLLTNLHTLDLTVNQIANIQSGDFDGLTNLRYLDVSYNQITSIESGGFDGLSRLFALNLGGNPITNIESGDFDGLTNLEVLNLHDNEATNIDGGAFEELTNLQFLFMPGNQITSIESGAFHGMTIMRSMDFSNNQITSIESGDFDGLSNLQGLNLRGNQITSIESGAFDGLDNLIELNLGFNPISSIEDLTHLLGLGKLSRLRVDKLLFSRYADEFSAWHGRVIVVPEPTAFCLVLVGMTILSGSFFRPQRLTSVASLMQACEDPKTNCGARHR